MPQFETDEGQLVVDLIYGRGERPRSTAPEPSLLPQLGTRLCHDFSIDEVLDATLEFSRHSTVAPPWTPLWDATIWGISGREDMQANLDSLENVTANYWQILRTLRVADRQEAARLATERIEIGYPYPDAAGVARLAPLLSRKQVTSLLDDPLFNPHDLDPESARSLLAAANAHSLQLPDDWIAAALNGTWEDISPQSRMAHLLPDLPPDARTNVADELAGWVVGKHLPPDARALWVSRIAPFVSSEAVWQGDELLGDLPDPWREHTRSLMSAEWPTEPWADVFRSHPENSRLLGIKRPHETTVGAPSDILSRWAALETASVERSGSRGEPTAGDAPAASSDVMSLEITGTDFDFSDALSESAFEEALPMTDTRRLQADITHRSSGDKVIAFVANALHLLDVSIGRGGQVRAGAEIEGELKKEFDKTDADSIELPVWFYAEQQAQQSTIKVPRDTSKNSTLATFAYTAPADGHALPRIHVMRPGGRMLLQSAVLAGDIVADVDTAKVHEPGFELNVDVVAGNLHDPAESSGGRTIITDKETGLTEEDGVLIEVNVAKIQKNFGDLVHDIETAADRQDRDDKAVDEMLVNAAKAGQQYRVLFKDQLRELAAAELLQIVSLEKDDVLPLELVYDGPPLATNSEICPTWRDALRQGTCSNCAGGGPDGDNSPARVCPMRFWSMSKVIERRTADARGGTFRVQAERSASRPGLRKIDAVVVAASGRVAGDEVDALKDFAANELRIPSRTAAHWEEWKSVVNATHPELLVAIPHNEAEAGWLSSKLLLGEPADDQEPVPPETALLAGSVTNEYVQSSDDNPGPIVLLLGCDTQFQQGQISGFAGEFRQRGAAVTVATFGELRADQAPTAARILMEIIVRPPDDTTSLGEAMRSARRQLLSDDLIMALLLVANGDADWQLPAPARGNQ